MLIVALGDSTTAGTPGFLSPIEAPPDGKGDVTSQYAYWLMQWHKDWKVVNRGVNGERSDQIAARFDRDVLAHKPDVVVRWPGQPEPTRAIEDHTKESEWFWEAFPDQHLDNRPYRIFFASGDHTCSVARFTGTTTGTLRNWNGDEIPPTGKSFEVDFYTVALWDDGQIVEENLMYDLVTFMQQLGLGG